MKEPEFSVNEQERLSELRSLQILDTPYEERFDRITRMAMRLFGVPIATVSLVDENRQWFKSCFGLDVRETERRISFCGHAILLNEALVVEDATQDERFHDNPLVTGEPRIRFYAGQPLRNMSGHGLGTLCILDREARKFTDEDRLMLADLAGMVEREMMAVELATSDELTHISNRRGFITLSKYTLDLCKRQLYPASLIFFYLDKFKQINYVYGHAEGDRALKLFAEQMRDSFRSSDLFARLGGDEFVALITNSNDLMIQELIDRFDKSLQSRVTELNLPYTVEFSQGIVAYDPLKHDLIDDMIREADIKMYENKASKR